MERYQTNDLIFLNCSVYGNIILKDQTQNTTYFPKESTNITIKRLFL